MVRMRVVGWAWPAAVVVVWLAFGNPMAKAADEVEAAHGCYQRHRADFSHYGSWPGHNRHIHGWGGYSTEGSWFQRPYPYHLDYYRMRYQGSYAPYFGNLYGPPTVVIPPAHGGAWYW